MNSQGTLGDNPSRRLKQPQIRKCSGENTGLRNVKLVNRKGDRKLRTRMRRHLARACIAEAAQCVAQAEPGEDRSYYCKSDERDTLFKGRLEEAGANQGAGNG